MLSLKDAKAARDAIRDGIYETPCPYSEKLSAITGSTVYVKLENLQLTGSFKERGALNKLRKLTDEDKKIGIVAASAGNHALGLSRHARLMNIPCTVVMPKSSQIIKVQNTRDEGAEVILHGVDFDEAYEKAVELSKEKGACFIPAFDDDDIIAGQASIGLELLDAGLDLDAVVVPVGGGGLISGIALALKESDPKIKVFGVEAAAAASMQAALDAGAPEPLLEASSLADGIALKRVGERNFEYVKKYVDDMVSVEEEEIAHAILKFLEVEKTVAEGAGAVPLAAILNKKLPVENKRIALILSGGNIDLNLLSHIIDRGLVREGRLIQLLVTLKDVPGALASLAEAVAELDANILEVSHIRAFAHSGPREVEVRIVLETFSIEHSNRIVEHLENHALKVTVLL